MADAQEESVPQAPEVEAPAQEEDAGGEAPPAAPVEADPPAVEAAPEPPAVDPAAAAAAAAAVAARLMQQHGQAPAAYPISSGAEHAQAEGEGNNNKRSRDELDGHEEEQAPDKKRASTSALLGGENGQDPLTHGGLDPELGGPMETLDIPSVAVGKLIGKAGETIRQLQLTTDTRIQVDHSGEGDTKRVTITGMSPEAVAQCQKEVMALVSEEESTESMECPAGVVGRIIGRGGETIRALQSASQAHITVDQNYPEGAPRKIIIQGKPDACRRASLMVSELINGEPGSAQAIIQRVCQEYGIGKTHVMSAPKALVGRIIGRQGDTIKQLQKATGATIQIDQATDPCRVTVAGQSQSADHAKRMIEEIIAGMDPFQPMGGGGPYGGGGGFGGGGGGFAPAPYGGGYGGYAPPYGFPPYGGGFPGGYGGAPAFPAYGADPYAAAASGGYGGGGFGGGAGPYGGGPGGPGAPPGGGGGSQWQELHDDQGRAYFWNAATNVTQWDKPAELGP